MSRDTKRQRIERNLLKLLAQSQHLSARYKYLVFDYIRTWCMFVVVDKDPLYIIDFDEEIEMLEKLINENPGNKSIESYYCCVKKTNDLIRTKYKDKRLSPHESIKISLKEMKFIRDGKLQKRSIDSFLDRLEKEE
jgi:hypothetical protein